MKNIICIFFGHVPKSTKWFGEIGDREYLSINYNDIPLAYFKKCSRCDEIFIDTIPIEGRKNDFD